MKSAVLFATHNSSDFISAQLKKLCDEVDHGMFDVYVLFNDSRFKWNAELPEGCAGIYTFNEKSAADHGFKIQMWYPTAFGKAFYGHNFEYSFMSFGMDHPEYDYIYLIEYDVYYNGNWNDLFRMYISDRADWISSNIISYDKSSDWWHDTLWKMFPPSGIHVDHESMIRTFNPMFRISRRAMKHLIILSRAGAWGFYECYIPTMLKDAGYDIEEWKEIIGHDQDDSESSMMFSPKGESISISDMKPGVLYHPVKHY